MLRMQLKDGRYSAVLICDACEQRINDAYHANAVFARGSGSELLEVFHVHKGACDQRLQPRVEGNDGVTGAEELTTHLVHLTHNCGFPAEKLVERARFLDERDEMGQL